MKSLPEELRVARKLAGRTQAECGAILGMSGAAYGYREAGKTPVTPEELETLAAFYNQPVSRLFPSFRRKGPEPRVKPTGLLNELRLRRIQAGLSNSECGEVLGISREAYRLREEGRKSITGVELAVLARRLYGMSLREAFPSFEPSPGELLFVEEILKLRKDG